MLFAIYPRWYSNDGLASRSSRLLRSQWKIPAGEYWWDLRQVRPYLNSLEQERLHILTSCRFSQHECGVWWRFLPSNRSFQLDIVIFLLENLQWRYWHFAIEPDLRQHSRTHSLFQRRQQPTQDHFQSDSSLYHQRLKNNVHNKTATIRKRRKHSQWNPFHAEMDQISVDSSTIPRWTCIKRCATTPTG